VRLISRLLSGRGATAITGVVFAALVLGMSVLGVAFGFGVFSTSKTITATIPEAGPALGPGSEVEYRGVLVGSLAGVHRTLHDAVLTIHLDPSQVQSIPAGATVRLVPRSVFGDLYVDLVPPSHITGPLQLPADLKADTSTPTVELDQALDAGYQLLTAVQPAKLDATLTAIAQALNGRGAKLGQLVEQVSKYTGQVAPHTGQLIHDITTVGTVGQELSRDAPDLLATLNDAVATSRTIVHSQPALTKLLNTGPTVADQTGTLLADNKVRLRTLVHLLRPVVGVLRGNQGNLVDAVKQLRAFLNGAAGALGHGPWLQVNAILAATLTGGIPYTAAQCPRYGKLAGGNCPKVSKLSGAAVADDLNRALGTDGVPATATPAGGGLAQRLAIAKVLLAPVLSLVGVTLP
jgi:virulence factor Mce-like protein